MDKIQKADKQEILSPLEYIDSQIGKLLRAEVELDQGWANVGILLEQVRVQKYWHPDYSSFRAYLQSLGDKYRKQPTQLYSYAESIRLLEPYATTEEMNTMGISMAQEITGAVKRGVTPPKDVIEAALKRPLNKVADIKKMLFEVEFPNSEQPQEEKGVWVDCSCYLSKEQFEVFAAARELAWHTDPECIKASDAAKTVDWITKFSMEFLNTYRYSEQKD